MTDGIAHRLTFAKRVLLAAAGCIAVAGPILVGVMNPPLSRAQAKQDALTFEVASLKPANPDARGVNMQFTPGGGVRVVGGSLRQIILMAYNIQRFQLAGAPGWLDSERYDIVAKAPDGSATDHDQARQRLQALLAERFQMAVHIESREGPLFALVPSKNGIRIKPSDETKQRTMSDGVNARPGQWVAEKADMELLTRMLSGNLGRPVLDKTGLKGPYAFKLDWSPEMAGFDFEKAQAAVALPPDPNGASIFTALEQQLGLKLEPTRGPIETIVIDHIEKPSGN